MASAPNQAFKCRDKCRAIFQVYFLHRPVSSVCRDFNISRQTFYRWERQFKKSIQPVWGGLSRKFNRKD